MKYKNLHTNVKIIFLTLLAFITACTDHQQPDVSAVKIDLSTQRLDKDIYALDTNNLATGLQHLKTLYPDFLDFYLDTLMGFNIDGVYTDSNEGIRKGLHTFLTYHDFRGLFDSIAQHYPDTKDIDAALKKGFQYLKYYYPNYAIPQIIYLNSNLNNYAAFTYDTLAIGIGLDMYLGDQYPFYKSVGLPDYMYNKLTKNYIVPNVFTSVYRAMYPFDMEGKTLLDMIIQKGKEQYFLCKLIPFTAEKDRLGYTQQQLDWCNESEAAVYHFFVDKQMLYSTNLQLVFRYVNDGPTSAGMPSESPGNIGSWLGYKIVKAYMDKFPETTLPQLLAIKDAQKILQQSKYNPK